MMTEMDSENDSTSFPTVKLESVDFLLQNSESVNLCDLPARLHSDEDLSPMEEDRCIEWVNINGECNEHIEQKINFSDSIQTNEEDSNEIKILNTFSLVNNESGKGPALVAREPQMLKRKLPNWKNKVASKFAKFDQVNEYCFTSFKSAAVANCFDAAINVVEDTDSFWSFSRMVSSYEAQVSQGHRPVLEPDLQSSHKEHGFRGVPNRIKKLQKTFETKLIEDGLHTPIVVVPACSYGAQKPLSTQPVKEILPDESILPPAMLDNVFSIKEEIPADAHYWGNDYLSNESVLGQGSNEEKITNTFWQNPSPEQETDYRQWQSTISEKENNYQQSTNRNEKSSATLQSTESSSIFCSKELDDLLREETKKCQNKPLFKVDTIQPSLAGIRFETPTTQSSYVKTLEAALQRKKPIDTHTNCSISPSTFLKDVNEKWQHSDEFMPETVLRPRESHQNLNESSIATAFLQVITRSEAQTAVCMVQKPSPPNEIPVEREAHSLVEIRRKKQCRWQKLPLVYRSRPITALERQIQVAEDEKYKRHRSEMDESIRRQRDTNPSDFDRMEKDDSIFERVLHQQEETQNSMSDPCYSSRKYDNTENNVRSPRRVSETNGATEDADVDATDSLLLHKANNILQSDGLKSHLNKISEKWSKNIAARKILRRSKSRVSHSGQIRDNESTNYSSLEEKGARFFKYIPVASRVPACPCGDHYRWNCNNGKNKRTERNSNSEKDATTDVDKNVNAGGSSVFNFHCLQEKRRKQVVLLAEQAENAKKSNIKETREKRYVWELYWVVPTIGNAESSTAEPSSEVIKKLYHGSYAMECSMRMARIFKIFSHCPRWIEKKKMILAGILKMDIGIRASSSVTVASAVVGKYFVMVLLISKSKKGSKVKIPKVILDIIDGDECVISLVQIYPAEVRALFTWKERTKGWSNKLLFQDIIQLLQLETDTSSRKKEPSSEDREESVTGEEPMWVKTSEDYVVNPFMMSTDHISKPGRIIDITCGEMTELGEAILKNSRPSNRPNILRAKALPKTPLSVSRPPCSTMISSSPKVTSRGAMDHSGITDSLSTLNIPHNSVINSNMRSKESTELKSTMDQTTSPYISFEHNYVSVTKPRHRAARSIKHKMPPVSTISAVPFTSVNQQENKPPPVVLKLVPCSCSYVQLPTGGSMVASGGKLLYNRSNSKVFTPPNILVRIPEFSKISDPVSVSNVSNNSSRITCNAGQSTFPAHISNLLKFSKSFFINGANSSQTTYDCSKSYTSGPSMVKTTPPSYTIGSIGAINTKNSLNSQNRYSVIPWSGDTGTKFIKVKSAYPPVNDKRRFNNVRIITKIHQKQDQNNQTPSSMCSSSNKFPIVSNTEQFPTSMQNTNAVSNNPASSGIQIILDTNKHNVLPSVLTVESLKFPTLTSPSPIASTEKTVSSNKYEPQICLSNNMPDEEKIALSKGKADLNDGSDVNSICHSKWPPESSLCSPSVSYSIPRTVSNGQHVPDSNEKLNQPSLRTEMKIRPKMQQPTSGDADPLFLIRQPLTRREYLSEFASSSSSAPVVATCQESMSKPSSLMTSRSQDCLMEAQQITVQENEANNTPMVPISSTSQDNSCTSNTNTVKDGNNITAVTTNPINLIVTSSKTNLIYSSPMSSSVGTNLSHTVKTVIPNRYDTLMPESKSIEVSASVVPRSNESEQTLHFTMGHNMPMVLSTSQSSTTLYDVSKSQKDEVSSCEIANKATLPFESKMIFEVEKDVQRNVNVAPRPEITSTSKSEETTPSTLAESLPATVSDSKHIDAIFTTLAVETKELMPGSNTTIATLSNNGPKLNFCSAHDLKIKSTDMESPSQSPELQKDHLGQQKTDKNMCSVFNNAKDSGGVVVANVQTMKCINSPLSGVHESKPHTALSKSNIRQNSILETVSTVSTVRNPIMSIEEISNIKVSSPSVSNIISVPITPTQHWTTDEPACIDVSKYACPRSTSSVKCDCKKERAGSHVECRLCNQSRKVKRRSVPMSYKDTYTAPPVSISQEPEKISITEQNGLCKEGSAISSVTAGSDIDKVEISSPSNKLYVRKYCFKPGTNSGREPSPIERPNSSTEYKQTQLPRNKTTDYTSKSSTQFQKPSSIVHRKKVSSKPCKISETNKTTNKLIPKVNPSSGAKSIESRSAPAKLSKSNLLNTKIDLSPQKYPIEFLTKKFQQTNFEQRKNIQNKCMDSHAGAATSKKNPKLRVRMTKKTALKLLKSGTKPRMKLKVINRSRMSGKTLLDALHHSIQAKVDNSKMKVRITEKTAQELVSRCNNAKDNNKMKVINRLGISGKQLLNAIHHTLRVSVATKSRDFRPLELENKKSTTSAKISKQSKVSQCKEKQKRSRPDQVSREKSHSGQLICNEKGVKGNVGEDVSHTTSHKNAGNVKNDHKMNTRSSKLTKSPDHIGEVLGKRRKRSISPTSVTSHLQTEKNLVQKSDLIHDTAKQLRRSEKLMKFNISAEIKNQTNVSIERNDMEELPSSVEKSRKMEFRNIFEDIMSSYEIEKPSSDSHNREEADFSQAESVHKPKLSNKVDRVIDGCISSPTSLILEKEALLQEFETTPTPKSSTISSSIEVSETISINQCESVTPNDDKSHAGLKSSHFSTENVDKQKELDICSSSDEIIDVTNISDCTLSSDELPVGYSSSMEEREFSVAISSNDTIANDIEMTSSDNASKLTKIIDVSGQGNPPTDESMVCLQGVTKSVSTISAQYDSVNVEKGGRLYGGFLGESSKPDLGLSHDIKKPSPKITDSLLNSDTDGEIEIVNSDDECLPSNVLLKMSMQSNVGTSRSGHRDGLLPESLSLHFSRNFLGEEGTIGEALRYDKRAMERERRYSLRYQFSDLSSTLGIDIHTRSSKQSLLDKATEEIKHLENEENELLLRKLDVANEKIDLMSKLSLLRACKITHILS